MVACSICVKELNVKSDRNLVDSAGSFSPKAEIESLEFINLVETPFFKYICRRCVELLKKRRKLLDNLYGVNSELSSLYNEGRRPVTRKTSPLAVERRVDCTNEIVNVVPEIRAEPVVSRPISCSTPKQKKRARPATSTECTTQSLQHEQEETAKTGKQQTSVLVRITWPTLVRERTLPDDLCSLGKMLVRGTYKQIANAVWKNPALRKNIIPLVGREIRKECDGLCSSNNPSLLRKTSKEDMLQFSLQKFGSELEVRSPILISTLKSAAVKTKINNEDPMSWLPAICMSAATLLKNRSPYMTSLQLLITIIIQHSGLMVS